MRLSGELVEIEEISEVNGFKKRSFVLEHCDKGYSQFVTFELFQRHCDLLDPFKIGDGVTVHFSCNGRKWTDKEGQVKYFNTLQAWKIVKERQED